MARPRGSNLEIIPRLNLTAERSASGHEIVAAIRGEQEAWMETDLLFVYSLNSLEWHLYVKSETSLLNIENSTLFQEWQNFHSLE